MGYEVFFLQETYSPMDKASLRGCHLLFKKEQGFLFFKAYLEIFLSAYTASPGKSLQSILAKFGPLALGGQYLPL